MNKILLTVVVITTTITLSTANNTSAEDSLYYIGVDLQNRSMGYNKDLGSQFMKRHVPEMGLFFGVKFNKYFGLEIGYEFSKHASSIGTVKSGEGKMLNVSPFNPPVINLFREHINTVSYHRNGLQLLLTGDMPVKKNQNISIFGAIGIIFNKIQYSQQHIEYEQYFYPGHALYRREIIDKNLYKLVTKKISTRPTIKAGIRFITPSNHIGFRIFGALLKDSRIFTNTTGGKHFKIHPKNSIVYGIGIFCKV